MAQFTIRLVVDPSLTPEAVEGAIPWPDGVTLYGDDAGRVCIVVDLDASRLELAVARITTEALLWQLPIVYAEGMTRLAWERRLAAMERREPEPVP